MICDYKIFKPDNSTILTFTLQSIYNNIVHTIRSGAMPEIYIQMFAIKIFEHSKFWCLQYKLTFILKFHLINLI